MSCGLSDVGHAFNADLIDLISDEDTASQQLSAGVDLPCPFSTAALTALASVALVLHGVLLLVACIQLARVVVRFRSSRVERWWSTFASRYLLLVLLMSGCAVLFTSLRLAGLSGRWAADGSSATRVLAVSFAPRAGASYGMSALLFVCATSLIAATAYSVNNTVHAALSTAKLVAGSHVAVPSSLPWHIRYFSCLSLGLYLWSVVVWCTVFVLPTAARASSPLVGQRTIALLLITLGNVSYWLLARTVTMATRAISRILTLDAPPQAAGGHIRVAPAPAHSPTVIHVGTNGLSSAQVESRNRTRNQFQLASTVIRNMLSMHVVASVAFAVCILALPSYYLQAYWLYANMAYWALVCLARLSVMGLPQPKH